MYRHPRVSSFVLAALLTLTVSIARGQTAFLGIEPAEPASEDVFEFVYDYACGDDNLSQPLYRVYNGRPDVNHRYVRSRALRDRMVAKWLDRGGRRSRHPGGLRVPGRGPRRRRPALTRMRAPVVLDARGERPYDARCAGRHAAPSAGVVEV